MLNFFLFQFPSGNNWSNNWTIFSLITAEFLYLQHKSLFHSHINFCLGLIIPFSSDPKWETIVHQGVNNPHSHYLSIPLSILGCTASGLQAVLCSTYSLTAGRARPALCREISRQLHLVQMMMLLVCPCLCLKMQQEVLIQTLFLCDYRNGEWSCFLVEKSYNSSNDQNDIIAPMDGAYMVCCALLKRPLNAANLRFPVSKEM